MIVVAEDLTTQWFETRYTNMNGHTIIVSKITHGKTKVSALLLIMIYSVFRCCHCQKVPFPWFLLAHPSLTLLSFDHVLTRHLFVFFASQPLLHGLRATHPSDKTAPTNLFDCSGFCSV